MPTAKPAAVPAKTGLARLLEPFAPSEIGLLPKAVSKDTQKFQCRQGTQASADNKYCGGYHTRSVHLDFVGHAALTNRMLEADPHWSWEPMALTPAGLPQFDQFGGLWIKLTICGVTRLGYGDAPGKNGGNAVKEAIGDALRNAGMRFGAALDLWHKGDLHDFQMEQGSEEYDKHGPAPAPTENHEPEPAPDPAPVDDHPPVNRPDGVEVAQGYKDELNARIKQLDDGSKAELLELWKQAGLPRLGLLNSVEFQTAQGLVQGFEGAAPDPYMADA